MLPERITRELRYVEIYTSRKMRNLRAGSYTSRLRGAGYTREFRPVEAGAAAYVADLQK